MKATELAALLWRLIERDGDQQVVIDTGSDLRVVEDVDTRTESEGIVICAGGQVED